MSSSSRQRIIVVLAALLATSPVWFVPLTPFPAVFGKMPLVLPLIALLGVLASLMSAPRTGSGHADRPLTIAVAVYVVISVLAAIFGIDPAQSVWGSLARATGLVTTAAFLTWFLSAPRLLPARGWRAFWWAAVIAAALESLLVIAEAAFPPVRGLLHETERYGGTLGNPSYLAGYLTMSFAAALLLLPAAGRRGRIALLCATAAIAAAVTLTGSRSGLLGLVASAAVAGAVLLAFGRGRVRRTAFAAIGVAVLVLVGGFLAPPEMLTRFGMPPEVQRVLNWRSYFGDDTRLIEWRIALDAFRARPVLGWGPENFQAAFDRHYRPELLRYSFYETVSDKPHNVPLEMLVAGGVPLLLAWLALFGAAVFCIIRARKRGVIGTGEAAAACAMLAAFLVHGLFLFETYPTGILFFSLLAWLAARLRPAPAPDGTASRPLFAARIGAAAFAVVALMAGPFAVPSLFAALRAADAETPERWSASARFSLDSWSVHRREIVKLLAGDFVKRNTGDAFPESFYRDTVRAVRVRLADEAERHPGDFTLQFMLGQVLAMEGELYASPDTLQQALAAIERANGISPRRQAVKFQLARILFLGEKNAEAINVLRSVVAEDPTLREPHWFLGLGLVASGDRAAGADELARSLALGASRPANELLYIIDIFDKEKRYAEMVPIYEDLLSWEPNNAAWHAGLAATYEKLGKPALAAVEAQRAVELDPTLQAEADQFLKDLRTQP